MELVNSDEIGWKKKIERNKVLYRLSFSHTKASQTLWSHVKSNTKSMGSK